MKMSISSFVKANFALYSWVAKYSDHVFSSVKLHINRWCFVLFLWGLRDLWILWYCFCRTFNIYHLLSSFILSLVLQEMYPLPKYFPLFMKQHLPRLPHLVPFIFRSFGLFYRHCFDLSYLRVALGSDSQPETLSESGFTCVLLLLGLHCPSLSV